MVSYVEAITPPADFLDFGCFHRVDKRSHALVVGAVRLHKIRQMKPVSLSFSGILDSEVVPLRKAVSAIIVFEVQFVSKGCYFDCFSQVSAFKPGFKNQSLVSWKPLSWFFTASCGLF